MNRKMRKKKKETQINNTYQILENFRASKKHRLIYRHTKTTIHSSHGRSGRVKTYTSEEIWEYEQEKEK